MFWNSFISICNDNNTTPTATVKALGISLGSVTKWKNGAQPNSTTLKKIADYFNVSVETLCGKKENPLAQFSPEMVALVERIRKLSPDMAKKALEYIDFIAQKK